MKRLWRSDTKSMFWKLLHKVYSMNLERLSSRIAQRFATRWLVHLPESYYKETVQSLEEIISSLFFKFSLDATIPLFGLIYIERLLSKHPNLKVESGRASHLFLASCLIAYKIHSDSQVPPRILLLWSRAIPMSLPPSKLAVMEREFLFLSGFSFEVSTSEMMSTMKQVTRTDAQIMQRCNYIWKRIWVAKLQKLY
eukprot:gb/GECH01011778.1/.p1 GENE.gb/GECH01011778.1/~~gb/GECH01011778.1/.p1  ORF type:complete len:196 (+),score=18.56 gb/GECH01011778.1/:1-588(+)